MNKVVLVGELIKNVTLGSTENGSENSFIIATLRVPKDPKKAKEVHFIYCKAFGKNLPTVLSKASIGDIISVSGQLATVMRNDKGEKQYLMEVWAESIKLIPNRIQNEGINNHQRMFSDAIRSYDRWESIGEKAVHTIGTTNSTNSKPIDNLLKNILSTDTTIEDTTEKAESKDVKEKSKV